MFIVMHIACLPEDEGCHQFIGACKTQAEAQACIQEQCADGYFSPSNFYITTRKTNAAQRPQQGE